ncbi:MAG: right-handed parallel beta-helix repeat-containing protein [Myxococcales bacterium]|nr:right-handed parallel beta-helix repeat-containing protein [Myxococcales bacterium]
MRRMTGWNWMTAGLLGLGMGCATDESTSDGSPTGTAGCTESRYPQVEGEAIHVATTCSSDEPDGSAAAPYSTLTEALAAAPAGATIAVAPGTYAETLEIGRDVRIVGLVDESKGIILQAPREGDAAIILKRPAPESADIILQVPSPDALGIILKSPAPETAAVRVVGGAALTLEGVRISDAARAGIEVESGSLVLASSRVEGTRAIGEDFGSGVVGRAGTSVTVRDSVVTGSAGVAVYFEKATGAIERSLLDANAKGGVLVKSTVQGSIILQDSVITGNGTAGVVVRGGRRIILKRTAVTATTLDARGVGDGVVVLDQDGVASSVSLEAGTTLAGNARVGLLVSGASSVTVDGAVVTSNDRGGIWLQHDAGSSDAEGVAITGTAIADNGFVGVAATLGASMRLSGSAVLSTVARVGFSGIAEIEVADGIGLLAGARARIEGNDIDDNPRVGIVADDLEAAGLYIGDNTISQSPVGIILQRPKDQVPTLAANTFEGTGEDLRIPTTEADLLPIPKAVQEGIAE